MSHPVLKAVGESATINVYVGYRLTGGDESSELRLYVDKKGDDSNDGRSIFRPLATIDKAVEIAGNVIGTTPSWATNAITGGIVHVGPSTDAHPHVISNPLTLPDNLTIAGVNDALRSVWVTPSTASSDGFLMASGCRLQGLSFKGFVLDPLPSTILAGTNPITSTLNGFVAAFAPGAVINRSPAIHDCTNHSNEGGGIKADADVISNSSLSRLMTLDAFTQVSSGGIGCLIDNDAFVEMVSFYCYAAAFHVLARNGGAGNMQNSNTGFGAFGLVADGYRTVTYPAGYVLPGKLYANGATTLVVNGADKSFSAGEEIPEGAVVKSGGATLRYGSRIITGSHNLEWVNGSIDGQDDAWGAYPPEQGGTGSGTIPWRVGVGSDHGVVIGTFTDESGNERSINRSSTAAFATAATEAELEATVAEEIVRQSDGTVGGLNFLRSILSFCLPFFKSR